MIPIVINSMSRRPRLDWWGVFIWDWLDPIMSFVYSDRSRGRILAVWSRLIASRWHWRFGYLSMEICWDFISLPDQKRECNHFVTNVLIKINMIQLSSTQSVRYGNC